MRATHGLCDVPAAEEGRGPHDVGPEREGQAEEARASWQVVGPARGGHPREAHREQHQLRLLPRARGRTSARHAASLWHCLSVPLFQSLTVSVPHSLTASLRHCVSVSAPHCLTAFLSLGNRRRKRDTVIVLESALYPRAFAQRRRAAEGAEGGRGMTSRKSGGGEINGGVTGLGERDVYNEGPSAPIGKRGHSREATTPCSLPVAPRALAMARMRQPW